MGRKIKPKRHRGVSDPREQAKVRLEKIKDVINNPPKVENDQDRLTNKARTFAKLKHDGKNRKIKKQTHGIEDVPKKYDAKKKLRPQKVIPKFKKENHETDEGFLRRVDSVTNDRLHEALYEAKYGVDVERDLKTGLIKITKREGDQLQNNKGKKRKLTQKEKDTIRDTVKKNLEDHKKSKIEPSEYKTDFVKFGETVHCPPTLNTPRRAVKSEQVSKPGQKNLLLKNITDPNYTENNKEQLQYTNKIPLLKLKGDDNNNDKTSKMTKIDKTGKRKNLPLKTRQLLENHREKVIEMYRNLKQKNMKPFPSL